MCCSSVPSSSASSRSSPPADPADGPGAHLTDLAAGRTVAGHFPAPQNWSSSLRVRTTTAAIAVAAIALAGCGGGDEANEEPTTVQTEGADAEGAAAEPVDLPDGVAAQVGEVDIEEGQLNKRLDAVLAQEQPTEQEGVTPEQREAAVASQVLSDLIVGQVILQGAEELGVAPTDEDISTLRDQVAEGAGGQEAFEQQASEAGYDQEAIERELRVLAAFQNVTEELLTEQGGDAATPGPEDQAAVQEWLVERLEATDITVDEQYGVWDPATGQILPAS